MGRERGQVIGIGESFLDYSCHRAHNRTLGSGDLPLLLIRDCITHRDSLCAIDSQLLQGKDENTTRNSENQ